MRIIFHNDGFLPEPFLSQMLEMVDCVSQVLVCFLAFAGNYKIVCVHAFVRAYVFVASVLFDVITHENIHLQRLNHRNSALSIQFTYKI